MNLPMEYVQHAVRWFNTLPLKRKLSLSGFLTFIILATVVLVSWVLSPSYGVLFSHLDDQEANQILIQLDQANINYQIQKGGSEILIAKNLIAKTRLKVMGSGMQLSNSTGFELFDKNDFGMTDFSQKINYQRALQGELERTISSLDEVRQTRVHLVLPESHLFEKEINQPRAAITLHLKKQLTSRQVRSIQRLASSSVAHLKLNHVLVMDQNGNTLSKSIQASTTTQLGTKKSVEQYLSDKVMQILHGIFRENQVMVKIDASINYDELQRELVKPHKQGLITHEKEIKHSSGAKSDKEPKNQDTTFEKSYQYGSEKEVFKRAKGTIDRLSISVLVPQNTDSQTLIQIQSLVKSSVGFNEARGDSISVEALINTPVPFVLPPSPLFNEPVLTQAWMKLLYFISGLFSISTFPALLVFKRIRNKRRQVLLIEMTQWLEHHEHI